MAGGIRGLLGLIARHRGAIEYDFRSRFHLGLSAIGEGITITEAVRLVEVLRQDPSSWTFAALAGWDHPLSREALALADLYDLQHQSKSNKRVKPYPRPWPDGNTRRRGRTDLSGSEVRAILRRFGHDV